MGTKKSCIWILWLERACKSMAFRRSWGKMILAIGVDTQQLAQIGMGFFLNNIFYSFTERRTPQCETASEFSNKVLPFKWLNVIVLSNLLEILCSCRTEQMLQRSKRMAYVNRGE